ncbi:hypothetical protein ACW4TU_09875 [Streptomyces sp. QTS52]
MQGYAVAAATMRQKPSAASSETGTSPMPPTMITGGAQYSF